MHISKLFDQDAKLLNDLVSLLTREQTSLVNMDIDVVESILDDKSVLIQKISESSKMRHAALAKAGFDADENGMATWIRAHAQEKEYVAWQAFQTQLAQAKELNRVNGQMINQHFKRNQQALNQLHGKGTAPSAGVYGPNGQTSSFNSPRGMLSV
ncbi:MAG: flagellar protein FlgN [Methylophilaceae bacterium]